MAVLNILEYPDQRLKQTSEEVTDFGDEFQKIVDDLFETMYHDQHGIGLAAPQVGIHQRVVVIDMTASEQKQPLCLVNPVLLEKSHELCEDSEGCLSVPGVYEQIMRPKRIKVEAYDRNGKRIEFDDDTYFSRCIQHEVDHLDGILFIDHLSTLKRQRVIQKTSLSWT